MKVENTENDVHPWLICSFLLNFSEWYALVKVKSKEISVVLHILYVLEDFVGLKFLGQQLHLIGSIEKFLLQPVNFILQFNVLLLNACVLGFGTGFRKRFCLDRNWLVHDAERFFRSFCLNFLIINHLLHPHFVFLNDQVLLVYGLDQDLLLLRHLVHLLLQLFVLGFS